MRAPSLDLGWRADCAAARQQPIEWRERTETTVVLGRIWRPLERRANRLDQTAFVHGLAFALQGRGSRTPRGRSDRWSRPSSWQSASADRLVDPRISTFERLGEMPRAVTIVEWRLSGG